MKKVCPRCGEVFECCSDGDMSSCHCTKVVLSAEARFALKARYPDCLCHACLLHFASNE